MLEEKMLEKKVWAVVGASNNKEKFGYKIYKKLKDRGYSVYPVNPNCGDIEGDKCYPDISSLPVTPEVIDMVVNPMHGEKVIDEASNLGVENIWFQPGSINDELQAKADSLGLNSVRNCVLNKLV